MKRKILILLIGISLITLCRHLYAQENKKKNEVLKGILSSFSFPLKDLFKKQYTSEWKNLLSGFSGNLGFSCPLQAVEAKGVSGQRNKNFQKYVASVSIKYNPISYWFFNTTFYYYPKGRNPWDPDFSYSFGYDDWHPYTLSLVYSNYGPNRLHPTQKGERFTRFAEGTFSLGWKFTVPKNIEKLFIVHPSGGIIGSINYNVTPRYFDLATLSKKHWKETFSITLKYTIYKWWYITVTYYYYPHPEQQQPWDPDYTYSFGYFDWHPGTIAIQYSNYAGNRYPWRKRGPGTGKFKSGYISISWSWKW